MTTTRPDDRRSPAPPEYAGRLLWLNAAVAWLGLGVQFVLSASGMYPVSPDTPLSRVGPGNAPGVDGLVARVVDYLSYFTILSNLVVAVVVTLLALDPRRDGRLLRVLRLDGLLMISITGIVYAVALAPTAQLRGWENLANLLIHVLTPLVTMGVWVVVGPRSWIRWRTVLASLVLPLVWLAYTLVRGEVIGAYPYPFVDVVVLGYGTALLNVAVVVVVALVLASVLLGVDRLLSRRLRTRGAPAKAVSA